MDVPIALLADTALTAADGKLSVIGIFGQINARQFPAVHPQCSIVLQFRASPGERGQIKRVQIRFMDADSVLAELASEFRVPDAFPDPTAPFLVNQILQIQGLLLPHAGPYAFHVLVNEEEKSVIRLDVAQLNQSTEPSE